MPRRRGTRTAARAPLVLAGLGAATLGVTGCGGGSQATAGETDKTFDVKVLKASFPAKQSIARPERMVLTVQNPGAAAIPNLTVTVDSFNYSSAYPGLAANKRPIWVIEQGPGTPAKLPVETQEVSVPGGAQTAYVNTWALGALGAHRTTTLTWKVAAVKSGSYTVHYTVGAGLAGKAKARLASGGPASGSLPVTIAPAPPETHVDPKTGKVVAGSYAGNAAELGR